MTDRPILFNGPMVRAILDGRKTQTRRVLKPQPPIGEDGRPLVYFPEWGVIHAEKGHYQELDYAKGDRLWVREAWCGCGQMDAIKPADFSRGEPIGYLADGEIRSYGCLMISQGKTRPSIHMPRWASRLTLVVTDVRVQRVQGISEADAMAEGMIARPARDTFGQDYTGWRSDWPAEADTPEAAHQYALGTARFAFANLWNATYGPDAWDANPWVTEITFETHRCNIDHMGENA